MSSLFCVMSIVSVLYFVRQVPLKWAVSCKAGLGHVFNHSSHLGPGGVFIHQIHNDHGGKGGNERNVFVSIYWDHLDNSLLLKKPHRGQGIWFLLSSCYETLEFSRHQPCTWLLCGLWCETMSEGEQNWRRRWERGLPACCVPVGTGTSTGSSWGGRALTLLVYHSTGTLALNDTQGLRLDISGFKRWARASLRGTEDWQLRKVLDEGCFCRNHLGHHVLGITAS